MTDVPLDCSAALICGEFSARVEALDLTGCRVEGSTFLGSEFDPVRMTDTIFEDCDLSGALFRRASLRRVEFRRCRMSGVAWPGAEFCDVRFVECKLDEAHFRMSKGERIEFTECAAAGIDFVEARWLGARLLRCDLTGAEFSNAKHGARLHGSKLDSVLGATALAGAIIDSTQLVPLATGLFGGLGIVIDDTPEQDGGRS